MTITITNKYNVALHPYFEYPRVVNGIEDGCNRAGALLDMGALDDFHINIRIAFRGIIPEWGVSAVFDPPTGNVIVLINPNNDHFLEDGLEQHLSCVVAHELHHRARHKAQGFIRTLADAVVMEGLALCFEQETGNVSSPFYRPIEPQEMVTLARYAGRELYTPNFNQANYDDFFMLDRGYGFSFHIIRAWLAENRSSAAEAVGVETKKVFDSGLLNEFSYSVSPTNRPVTVCARFNPPPIQVLPH